MPSFGWPIGFSRANVKHLGGLSADRNQLRVVSLGSVHFYDRTNKPIRILGSDEPFQCRSVLRLGPDRDIQNVRSGEYEEFSRLPISQG